MVEWWNDGLIAECIVFSPYCTSNFIILEAISKLRFWFKVKAS